jgi:hypothetical protein
MSKQKQTTKSKRFTHLLSEEDLAMLLKVAKIMNRTPSDTLRELVREKHAETITGTVLPVYIDPSPDKITKDIHKKVTTVLLGKNKS